MMKVLSKILDDEISNLEKQGLLITPKVIQSAIGPEIIINSKKYINFSSNNYLGFANNPKLKKAAISAIKKYGVGPAAVRTIAGTMVLHQELEKKLSAFKKAEGVILYQSGFVANLSVIPAIISENDIIFSDELNHASIIDACRLTKAQVIRFNHLDTVDLSKKINAVKNKTSSDTKKMIITDGVFSMDGDIAPLPDLVAVSEKYNCILMVDDAHGEGVLGKNGRGIVDHFNLHGKVDIEIGTLSKAFGVVGGFAAGKKEIIQWLKQKSRPFLFSSAMTVPDAAACIEAVNILEKSDELTKKLWTNTSYFKKGLKELGFNIGESVTPITPIMIGEEILTKKFSEYLFENGIFATAICYPTVAKGKSRIRTIISASHKKSHLDYGIKVFSKVRKILGIL